MCVCGLDWETYGGGRAVGTGACAVDERHVCIPNFPGGSHEATTAPTDAILGSGSNGLVPLSDLETSAVTRSLPRSLALMGTASAPKGPAGALGGQASPLIPSESASLNPGATIRSAMQSLHGELGSFSVLTGGGQ